MASTLRDDVLPIIADGWGLVEEFGFTQWTCTVRMQVWSEGVVGQGTATITDLVLDPNPWVTERSDGSLLLEGITPTHVGGGYSHSQLNPAHSAGVESYWVVTGPNGTHSYDCSAYDDSDATEIRVTLAPMTRRRPF